MSKRSKENNSVREMVKEERITVPMKVRGSTKKKVAMTIPSQDDGSGDPKTTITIPMEDTGSVEVDQCDVERDGKVNPSEQPFNTQPLLTIEYGYIQKSGSKNAAAKTKLGVDPRCRYVKVGNQLYLMCPKGVTC